MQHWLVFGSEITSCCDGQSHELLPEVGGSRLDAASLRPRDFVRWYPVDRVWPQSVMGALQRSMDVGVRLCEVAGRQREWETLGDPSTRVIAWTVCIL